VSACRHTLPPLVFGTLRLLGRVHKRETSEDTAMQIKSKKVVYVWCVCGAGVVYGTYGACVVVVVFVSFLLAGVRLCTRDDLCAVPSLS